MSVSVMAEKTCTGIGEGPHWETKTQSLLYVDVTAREIHRLNTETGIDEKRTVGEEIGFVIPRTRGGYVIGQQRHFSIFDWDTNIVQGHICEVDQGTKNRINDAKVDAKGTLWAGSMGSYEGNVELERHMGKLYSLDADHILKQHIDKIDISNGIAWSLDNSIMYYIDSIPRKVYAFDFDVQQGTINNQRVAVDFSGNDTRERLGLPDGMCIDAQGKLWVACFNGAKVVRFDPETGKELQYVDIPARRITSCCFGGRQGDELYVTSAVVGADDAEWQKYPHTGSVFKVTGLNGIKGAPAPEFAG